MSNLFPELTVGALFHEPSHSIAFSELQTCTYPWELLSRLPEIICRIGATLSPDEYERQGEDIFVARTARIAPTACITGPCIIGPGAEVRHAAFLRGSAILGEGTVVGNSTELKNCLLFDRVQVPHYNYVGDSILGYMSHLGAGAVTSNVKSDKSPVNIRVGDARVETGRKKLGAMIGDHVEVGCHAVLNPGTVIGRGSSIYPLSMVRGYVPADSIYKSGTQIVPKRK